MTAVSPQRPSPNADAPALTSGPSSQQENPRARLPKNDPSDPSRGGCHCGSRLRLGRHHLLSPSCLRSGRLRPSQSTRSELRLREDPGVPDGGRHRPPIRRVVRASVRRDPTAAGGKLRAAVGKLRAAVGRVPGWQSQRPRDACRAQGVRDLASERPVDQPLTSASPRPCLDAGVTSRRRPSRMRSRGTSTIPAPAAVSVLSGWRPSLRSSVDPCHPGGGAREEAQKSRRRPLEGNDAHTRRRG